MSDNHPSPEDLIAVYKAAMRLLDMRDKVVLWQEFQDVEDELLAVCSKIKDRLNNE